MAMGDRGGSLRMICRLAGDRVVISRRLGFARWTDRTLVFENGGIAEATLETLVAGRY